MELAKRCPICGGKPQYVHYCLFMRRQKASVTATDALGGVQKEAAAAWWRGDKEDINERIANF